MENLTITIDTKEPIPISVFNKSLEALSNQYRSITNESSELYISKLKEGSYIIELVTVSVAAILPIITNFCTIVQFIDYLKLAKNWLLGSTGKPTGIQIAANDLQEIKELLAPALVINNYGSMNFYYNAENKAEFSKDEIRTITYAIDNEVAQAEKPITELPILAKYNKVLFYWYQTRFDDKHINLGNKGIIETIESGPKNVIFADDSSKTKFEMTTIHPEIKSDWQKIGYIVDVEVIKSKDTIKAYKILNNYMSDCIID